jgi:hypothetical protein
MKAEAFDRNLTKHPICTPHALPLQPMRIAFWDDSIDMAHVKNVAVLEGACTQVKQINSPLCT